MQTRREAILAAVLAASAWNLTLVVSAVFNAHWVLSRVDGGKFQSLPPGLRFTNLGFTVLTIWVMIFAWRLWKSEGVRNASDARWAKLVIIMYTLSAVINAVSSSPNERLNAIPAAMIVSGFFLLRRPVD